MSLIEVIQNELFTDDCDNSEMLEARYNKANEKGKELIDNVLMDICGWTLPTLIKMSKEE